MGSKGKALGRFSSDAENASATAMLRTFAEMQSKRHFADYRRIIGSANPK